MTAVELLPVHQYVSEPFLIGRGLSNYWGYNTLGFFAPHSAYGSVGTLGQQVREFKEMVSRAARGRHRGDPRRGLQPHRRGRPRGPDAGLPRPGPPRLLPADRRPAQRLRRHRLRQLGGHLRARGAAADLGLAALLGDRDGRRRLPLRPGHHAAPRRAAPRRPAARLQAGHPRRPGAEPGQDDRRAVGHGPVRLPGRRLRHGLERVERPLPQLRPRLLARQHPRRLRAGASGCPARPTSSTTARGRRRPASTSSPPTTASRCATWSPTTSSTTAPTASPTATAPTTTGPGTAASRARPTTPA